jgi:hypothetical protein
MRWRRASRHPGTPLERKMDTFGRPNSGGKGKLFSITSRCILIYLKRNSLVQILTWSNVNFKGFPEERFLVPPPLSLFTVDVSLYQNWTAKSLAKSLDGDTGNLLQNPRNHGQNSPLADLNLKRWLILFTCIRILVWYLLQISQIDIYNRYTEDDYCFN